MNCDDVDVALAVASVSGGMEPGERAAVAAHVQSCARCARAAREYLAAAERLAVAVEPLEPPARLRAAILREVRADAATRSPMSRRRNPLAALWQALPQGRAFTAAGLAAAVALAGVVAWSATSRGSSTPSALAADVRATVPGQAQGAAGTLTYFPAQHTALLRMHDLPPLASQVYEVWLVRRGIPTAAGFLTLQPDGTWSSAVSGVDGAGVTVAATIEPPQGSTTPTGTRVLAVQVPS